MIKLNHFLSFSFALCTLSAGCAVQSQNGGDVQSDESSEALRRSQVVGTFVRTEHRPSCNLASTIELKANGSFTAELNYAGPTVLCAEIASPTLRGTYTVNSSNRVTFRPAGRRGTFTLKYARGVLSDLRGQRQDDAFEGSFRKLSQGQCVSDAACGANEDCLFPLYAAAGNGGDAPTDSGNADVGFIFPPVPVGQCVVRDEEPGPIVCSSVDGLYEACPIGYTCVEPQILPCTPDQSCGGREPQGICVRSNDPVQLCGGGSQLTCPAGQHCASLRGPTDVPGQCVND